MKSWKVLWRLSGCGKSLKETDGVMGLLFSPYLGMLARAELPLAVVALQTKGMVVFAERALPLSC